MIARTWSRSTLSARSVSSTGTSRRLAILLLAVPSLLCQQTPTFSSEVKVVNVLATVRDKHGQIVNTLTKNDFKLEQDGQPQTIGYFARICPEKGLHILARAPENQNGADKTWVLHFLRRLERLFGQVRPAPQKRHGPIH